MKPFFYKEQIINLDLCKHIRLMKNPPLKDYIQIDEITLTPENPQEVFNEIRAIILSKNAQKGR